MTAAVGLPSIGGMEKMNMKRTSIAIACALAALFACTGQSDASCAPSRGEANISVFAGFLRKIAKERNVSLTKAADMLYDIGVRGFDAGPDEPDVAELCATKLRPVNLYYFPNWFKGRKGYVDTTAPAECLSFARRLGFPRVMVVPPNFTDGKDSPVELEATLVMLRGFVEEAKKQGVEVLVEDFGGRANPCSYAKYLKRFLSEIPDLRLALDSGNLYYAGRGDDILELMEFADGRIGHVHLKDQAATNSDVYVTLGAGAVPNERIVRTLCASGYAGWYTLENPVGDTYEDTVRQVAVLKSWLGNGADVHGNATLTWRPAIERLKDGSTLSIPKGEYHFGTNGSCRMWLDPSNNSSGWKSVVFPLVGRNDIVIDGNGSTFVFHDGAFPFAVTNCRNVTIRNLEIKTRFAPWACLSVARKDEAGFEIQLTKGACPYTVRDGELRLELDGAVMSTRLGRISLHSVDRIRIHYLVAPDTPGDRSSYPSTFVCGVPRDLGGGRIRFDYAGAPHPKREAMPFRLGERCAINLAGRRLQDALFFEDCDGVVVENVRIPRFGGMGVVAQRSGNIRISGLDALPEDGECVSLTADVIQLINCHGSAVIENCRSAYSMDDVLNIHGNYLRVEGVSGEKVRLRAMHEAHEGFFPYRPGDTVEFVEAHSRTVVHVAKVVSCTRDPSDRFVCTLVVDAGAQALRPDLLVENATLNPDVVLVGNDFHHHPNIRLSGRGKYLIEKNRIADTYSALVVLDLAEYWYESGRVSEMTIRDNDFVNCNALGGNTFMTFGVSGWENQAGAPKIHGTIRLENNRYVGVKEHRWVVDGVREWIGE